MLAMAAPTSVPATPKKDAITAADSDASAPATIATGLILFGWRSSLWRSSLFSSVMASHSTSSGFQGRAAARGLSAADPPGGLSVSSLQRYQKVGRAGIPSSYLSYLSYLSSSRTQGTTNPPRRMSPHMALRWRAPGSRRACARVRAVPSSECRWEAECREQRGAECRDLRDGSV